MDHRADDREEEVVRDEDAVGMDMFDRLPDQLDYWDTDPRDAHRGRAHDHRQGGQDGGGGGGGEDGRDGVHHSRCRIHS